MYLCFMNELLLKYNLLDTDARKEVRDLLDLLLSRNKHTNSDLSLYKKKMLTISTWSEEDIDEVSEVQKKLNQWLPKEW